MPPEAYRYPPAPPDVGEVLDCPAYSSTGTPMCHKETAMFRNFLQQLRDVEDQLRREASQQAAQRRREAAAGVPAKHLPVSGKLAEDNAKRLRSLRDALWVLCRDAEHDAHALAQLCVTLEQVGFHEQAHKAREEMCRPRTPAKPRCEAPRGRSDAGAGVQNYGAAPEAPKLGDLFHVTLAPKPVVPKRLPAGPVEPSWSAIPKKLGREHRLAM